MKKPLIGITLDEEETKTYSKYPWYAARKNYSESIEKAGGVCIFLPNNSEEIAYYLKLIDGLVEKLSDEILKNINNLINDI